LKLTAQLTRLVASPRQGRTAAVALAVLCVLGLVTLAPNLFRGMEERAGDTLWAVGAAAAGDDEERRFVVVDIDEASIARVGSWPWSRERMAELSRALGTLGASLQIFDIVLPEQRPGDAMLAQELARQQVVLAEVFSLDPRTPVALGQVHGALERNAPPCDPPLPHAFGYVANTPGIASAPGVSVGHITPRIGRDGAVRHLPPLVCFEGRVYPALALAAVVKGAGVEPAWSLAPGRGMLDPAWRLSHAQLPGISVPIDANGDARLSYRLPRRALLSVSAADVLEGRAPEALFRGAWVLVGATAFGIGDAVPTPHGGAVGGVEVHAQFISALLDGRIPYAPRGAPLALLLLSVMSAAILLLATRRQRFPALGLPLLGVTLALAFVAVHAWLQLTQHLWLGWGIPAAFSVFAGIFLGAAEHARTRFERERLYGNLTSYLPEPVAADIAFREPTGAIDAQRQEITVLFADIRNFSAYCEARPAEEAGALLHAFFTTAARIIEAHGGLIEEFVGDAVMAVWNTPRPCPDHAAKALAAAKVLHAETQEFFRQTPPGLEPLALGIGIETGSALVGSFGPARRRTHTAMGETITVAARLQALTVDLAQPILVGEGTARLLPDGSVSSLGSFLLEGLRTSRQIYAPPLVEAVPLPDDRHHPTRPRLVSGLRKI
jgi:adenylate cyclase